MEAIPCGASSAFVFTFSRRKNCSHACAQSAIVIAGFEMWLDFVLDDSFGQRVWQHALQSVTDLNEQRPVLDEYKQHRAVILGFLPDLPRLSDARGVIFNGRIGIHLRENGDK